MPSHGGNAAQPRACSTSDLKPGRQRLHPPPCRALTSPCSSSIPASAACPCSREIRALLPTAPIVYAADNAGFPYGTKSSAEIEARVPALLGRLAERLRSALIVIACNTASTIALDPVRAALDLPIVGTVPAIKPAAALSKTRAIGVLGTAATIVQPYVDRLAAEFAADCIVVRHGSAELVDLAEAKLRGEATDPDGLCADSGRPALPARRRGGGHDRPRLHPFSAGRGRARGGCAAPARPSSTAPAASRGAPPGCFATMNGLTGTVKTSPCSPARSPLIEAYRAALAGYGLTRVETL